MEAPPTPAARGSAGRARRGCRDGTSGAYIPRIVQRCAILNLGLNGPGGWTAVLFPEELGSALRPSAAMRPSAAALLRELFRAGTPICRRVDAGWYLTYRLSYRDLVELMAEWGVHVNHTTI